MKELIGMIDPTITLGNVIQILTIIAGGIGVIIMMRLDVSSLKQSTQSLQEDVLGMQSEIKKLTDILVNIADIRGDIRGLSTRLSATEADIREMRHGQGFVRGPHGIDREWP